jgi:hypothetical protein
MRSSGGTEAAVCASDLTGVLREEAMHRIIATVGTIAFAVVSTPAARAAPLPPEGIVQVLAGEQLAYVEKGGKGWKQGKRAKWRHGPPPWAPAHGLRRKRGW